MVSTRETDAGHFKEIHIPEEAMRGLRNGDIVDVMTAFFEEMVNPSKADLHSRAAATLFFNDANVEVASGDRLIAKTIFWHKLAGNSLDECHKALPSLGYTHLEDLWRRWDERFPKLTHAIP